MHETLFLLVTLLLGSVVTVGVTRRMGLPPIIGYLLVGVVIGPSGLNLLRETATAQSVAEFGIVFLMFSIGLEFSLAHLKAMRRVVFGLGAIQVLVTVALLMGVAAAVGLSWIGGFVVASALAMSSTAILSKLLSERMELEKPHGREVIGVLLFQDLAVVPILILMPALAKGGEGEWFVPLALAFLKATIALAVVLRFGQPLMRRWFGWVARERSSEFFTLNVLLVTIGMAMLSELLGLSLALGAFLAGMLIAETEYRYQVEEDIKPFRDVLLGLFFITVGMFLDVRVVVAFLPWVAATIVVVAGVKAAVVWLGSRAMGSDTATALRSALWLATAGEFGFVVLALGERFDLTPQPWPQVVAASLVLSMLMAPLIVQFSDQIVLRVVASEWLRRSLELTQIAARTVRIKAPVLLLGYGRTGQHMAKLLDKEGISIVALDLDPERVRRAQAAGENVVYGDAARSEVLKAAGLMRAQAVVITFSDRDAALRILSAVQALRPEVPVVVRVRDESDMERMFAAGAAEVIPEAIEVAVMMAVQTLALVGVPLPKVVRHLRALREERYRLFRGFFSGVTDLADEESDAGAVRLDTFVVEERSPWIDRALADLALDQLGVEVVAVRRRGIRGASPDPHFVLRQGDVLIVRGKVAALEAARERFLAGPEE
ncbi:monovalent cation:proton antiporter family protein [Hydrogenophilus islandicus]